MPTRFGLGYDSHRFGADRPLKLGGTEIPHTSGLVGHSDGDAVAHAVTDALLGAAALGDIGQLFPNDDPQWKDADSFVFLDAARVHVTGAGYTIVNVDATVVTEAPKLAPHVPKMREWLATTLQVPLTAVSVKAKTAEKMDAVGKGEGLVVYAITSIDKGAVGWREGGE